MPQPLVQQSRGPLGGSQDSDGRRGDDLSTREWELLSVTIDVLEEHGYDRLTIDEVAARAHASKATIYRRWPSKAVLITAAVAARMDTSAFNQPLGEASLRDELVNFVRLLAAEGREVGAAVAGLLGEAIRNSELRANIEDHFIRPRRDVLRASLERRQANGEIADGLDLDLVGVIPAAVIYHRLLITHETIDETLPERIVDELMLPLLTGRLATPAGRPARRRAKSDMPSSDTRP